MSAAWLVAAVCLLATLWSLAGFWRGRAARRPAVNWTLLALQPLLATALFLALFPPSRPQAGERLQVLAAGARANAAQAGEGGVVALPEARDPGQAERVPDLATALRRRPQAGILRVHGDYLPARDRDALAGRGIEFQPPPAPSGLAALWPPRQVAAGAAFAVHGRVEALPEARLELFDPAGQRVAAVRPDAQGLFALRGRAGAAGPALFSLRLLDAGGRERERVPVPVDAAAAPRLKLLLLAGAPQPELKYLRRWAIDAGLSLHTRIAAGGGLVLGDAPMALDAATLDAQDLVLLDERALAALSAGERRALAQAMRRGLGVLLRSGGRLDDAARAALRAWGLSLGADAGLGGAAAPAPPEAGQAPPPALSRRLLAPVGEGQAQALARDAAGQPVAWWHALGRGRLGVSTLTDSYLWVLAGRADLHSALWSDLLSPLARARGAAAPLPTPQPAWAGERVVLCGLRAAAAAIAPDGTVTPLRVDPRAGAGACAGYWPEQAGWHVLREGGEGEGERVFYVHDPAQAATVYRHAQREATWAVAGGTGPAAALLQRQPGPRWPGWLAFLVLAALSWWLERRRAPAPAGTEAAAR